MKKKILSLVLVAAMLASMLVFAPVSGASEKAASIDVTETVGFAGSTVSVDVILTFPAELGNLEAAQGLFTFDTTRLELVDRTRGDFWGEYGGTFAGDYDAKEMFASYISDSIKSVNASGLGDDASEGVVAFTLTFKIKEDAPAGDAEITFVNIGYPTRFGNNANAVYMEEDVDYIAGKVTVLDGAAPVTDPADFVIEELDESTCKIVEYFGDASVLNIPSEINGLTVVEIGSMIFCDVDHTTFRKVLISGTIDKSSGVYRDGVTENNTVTTIIVPATVTTINDYAFLNANVCSSVVLLGGEFDYVATNAFGYVGATWNAGTGGAAKTRGTISSYGYPEGDEYTEEEELLIVENVKLSVVSVEALGEDFLNNGEFVFNTTVLDAANEIAVTIGDATTTYSAFGAAIKAPSFAGVVAWVDAEGNSYAPGADLGDATAITAVVANTPVTSKVTDEFAMRFQAAFAKATYDELAELGEVTMGMLITPRQYVLKAGNVFTKEALDALVAGTGYAGYVDVPVTSAFSAVDATGEETTDFANCVAFNIAGALTGLKDTTAAKDPDFVAIGYMQAGDVIVYSEYNASSSMKVSTFLANVNTEGLGDTELGWIDAWKNLFNK